MNTKKENFAVIIEQQSQGNSFGDRTFTVTVEVRDMIHNVLATQVFQETAFEGEHADRIALLTRDINAWAREHNATFTGSLF